MYIYIYIHIIRNVQSTIPLLFWFLHGICLAPFASNGPWVSTSCPWLPWRFEAMPMCPFWHIDYWPGMPMERISAGHANGENYCGPTERSGDARLFALPTASCTERLNCLMAVKRWEPNSWMLERTREQWPVDPDQVLLFCLDCHRMSPLCESPSVWINKHTNLKRSLGELLTYPEVRSNLKPRPQLYGRVYEQTFRTPSADIRSITNESLVRKLGLIGSRYFLKRTEKSISYQVDGGLLQYGSEWLQRLKLEYWMFS